MNKLELKHLAAYLPYGLTYLANENSDINCDLWADHAKNIMLFSDAVEIGDKDALILKNSIIKITDLSIHIEKEGDIFLGQGENSLGYCIDDLYISECKPILRPLSDLTKEIEHNGEKFVPIIRMVKECHFTDTYELKFFETRESRSKRKEYRVGYNSFKIYWDILIYIDGMRHDYVQKLIEWHFDIYGLIDSGLAIDINTLKNE